MKRFLYDYTNYGVLYVTSYENPAIGQWEMNILRNCILDSNFGLILPSHSRYAELDNSSIRENFYSYILTQSDQTIAKTQNSNLINQSFKEKQRLSSLRYPLIERLCFFLRLRSLSNISSFDVSIDNTLYSALQGSDLLQNIWSPGVIEYAGILNLSPAEAYQEILVDYKTVRDYQMRAYAMSKKYESLIRQVQTEEQAKNLMLEISQKLFKDTMI